MPRRASPGSVGGLSRGGGPPPLGCQPPRQLPAVGGVGAARSAAGRPGPRRLPLDAPPPGTCQKHKRAGNLRGAVAFLRVEGSGFSPSPPSPPHSKPGLSLQLASARSLARPGVGANLAAAASRDCPPHLSALLGSLRSRHGANLGLLRVATSQQRALWPKSPRVGYGLGRKRGQPRGNEQGREVR